MRGCKRSAAATYDRVIPRQRGNYQLPRLEWARDLRVYRSVRTIPRCIHSLSWGLIGLVDDEGVREREDEQLRVICRRGRIAWDTI